MSEFVVTMSHPIKSAASTGFVSPALYDAHRPSFPPASVKKLLEALQLVDQPGARVLELGAGTGKFTALLSARPERFEVLSVEPHPQMRPVLEGKRLPGIRVIEGTAERMDAVEDGWADACVVAQVSYVVFQWKWECGRMHDGW